MYDKIKPKLAAIAIEAFGAENAMAFPQYILNSNSVSDLINIFKNKREMLAKMINLLPEDEQNWIYSNIFIDWLNEGNRQ